MNVETAIFRRKQDVKVVPSNFQVPLLLRQRHNGALGHFIIISPYLVLGAISV